MNNYKFITSDKLSDNDRVKIIKELIDYFSRLQYIKFSEAISSHKDFNTIQKHITAFSSIRAAYSIIIDDDKLLSSYAELQDAPEELFDIELP